MSRYRRFVFVAALALGACSSDATESPQAGNSRSVGEGGPALPAFDQETDGSPSLLLRSGEAETIVAPFAYCWTSSQTAEGICADGEPEQPLPSIVGTSTIEVYFVDPDFMFESRFLNVDLSPRAAGPTLKRSGDHWELEPPEQLPVVVELFGVNGSNDIIASFTILP